MELFHKQLSWLLVGLSQVLEKKMYIYTCKFYILSFIWSNLRAIWLISSQKQIQGGLSCHHLSYQDASVIQRKRTCLPLGILHFLSDVVECVPSRVGEEGGVESQCNHPWVCGWALEGSSQVFRFSCTNHRDQLPVTFQGLRCRMTLHWKSQLTKRK